MVNFQKFQFDNFVIGEVQEMVSEVSNIITDVEAEVVSEELFSAYPLSNEPAVTAVKTFTEEELAQEVRKAQEHAYENGFKAAQTSLEKENNHLLEEINNRLLMLAANVGEQECRLEDQAISVARSAIHKLIPVLEKENSQEIINNFLIENFKNFKEEAKLAFYFHPDTVPFVQETIARLANVHDFEGKISLHKDSKLGIADCRIEWENGGVERNSNKMLEKVDNLLEEASHKN